MDTEEIKREMKLKYTDLVKYLQKKYGYTSGSYFLNESCKSPNREIKRTSDGLTIHHVKENEHIDLSKIEIASKFPYEYQSPKNLVYCNPLEHFILHKKIVEEYLIKKLRSGSFECVGIGGILNYIAPTLNSSFFERGYVMLPYQQEGFALIKDNKSEYIELLVDTAASIEKVCSEFPLPKEEFGIQKLWSSNDPKKATIDSKGIHKGSISELKNIILKKAG